MLFSAAEQVVEGSPELAGTRRNADAQRTPGARQRRVYATVMVTIDLRACSAYFRERSDDATAERVAELMQDNEGVLDKLVTLARPRLAELAAVAASGLEISLDFQVRADGCRVLIDADAMGRW